MIEYVEIGPVRYVVMCSEDGDKELQKFQEHENRSLGGHVDVWRGIIYIRSDMCEDQKRDTLVHECLHACADQTGLEFCKDSTTEEAVVGSFSPRVFDLVKRNPHLVNYLTGRS